MKDTHHNNQKAAKNVDLFKIFFGVTIILYNITITISYSDQMLHLCQTAINYFYYKINNTVH